jgi:hypothetical protein
MVKRAIIRRIFNIKMERYGQMLKLDINSKDKTIDLEVLLRGEASPLHIHIGHYEIKSGEESGVKISKIQTSREWITDLIHALAPEHMVKFDHANLLKIVL